MKYSPNQANHLKARQVNKNIEEIIITNQVYAENKIIEGFALNLLNSSKLIKKKMNNLTVFFSKVIAVDQFQ